MSPERPEKLITMANQIAMFFDSQPDDPVENVLGHLRDFWDPRMRETLKTYAANDGTDLLPTVQKAAARL